MVKKAADRCGRKPGFKPGAWPGALLFFTALLTIEPDHRGSWTEGANSRMPKADINGNRMHFYSEGKGIPILFIHPPLLNSAVFAYQAAQLSGSFRVISFDLRGHGYSRRSERPVTYPLIVEDMKQLLDHLRIERAYLCGYSTGGSIALEFMLTHADRCLGAILVSAMSEVSDWGLKWRIRLAKAACAKYTRKWLAMLIAGGNADSWATFTDLYRHALSGSADHWRQYFQCSLTYRCTERLPRIDLPVLLIHGANDRRFARYAAKLRQRLPQSRLVDLKNQPHQIPTKASDMMNEAVRLWIAGQPIPPRDEAPDFGDGLHWPPPAEESVQPELRG